MKYNDGQFQLVHLAIMVTIALLLWHTILIYPIKLFVVMLHEMSHGLMAVIFGGEIIEIQIDQRLGGYCKFKMEPSFWGSFMTGSAGYLGSLFWGSLILLGAVKSKKDKYITLIIGFVLLGLSYFVFQSGEIFGTSMTVGLGLFMLVAYRFLGPSFHDLWLKFIGITSCLYVILDIKNDLIDRSNIGSDADKIGELIHLPGTYVGVFWMVLAAINLFLVLKYIYRQKEIG